MNQSFGQAVKDARQRRGLTQRALADRLKELGVSVDQASIARMEAGKREPRLGEALEISEYLGFDVNSVTPSEGAYLTRYGMQDKTVHDFYRARAAIEEYLESASFAIGLYRPSPDESDPGYRTIDEYAATMLEMVRTLPGREAQSEGVKPVTWERLHFVPYRTLAPFVDALTAGLAEAAKQEGGLDRMLTLSEAAEWVNDQAREESQ